MEAEEVCDHFLCYSWLQVQHAIILLFIIILCFLILWLFLLGILEHIGTEDKTPIDGIKQPQQPFKSPLISFALNGRHQNSIDKISKELAIFLLGGQILSNPDNEAIAILLPEYFQELEISFKGIRLTVGVGEGQG